jgi:hypothetical protein
MPEFQQVRHHTWILVPLHTPPPKKKVFLFSQLGAFETAFDRCQEMFIFHTLVFALCIIVSDSYFFPRYDTSQKDINFLLTVNQKVLAIIQAFKLELLCEVLGTHLA